MVWMEYEDVGKEVGRSRKKRAALLVVVRDRMIETRTDTIASHPG